jgi:hypothetical protein
LAESGPVHGNPLPELVSASANPVGTGLKPALCERAGHSFLMPQSKFFIFAILPPFVELGDSLVLSHLPCVTARPVLSSSSRSTRAGFKAGGPSASLLLAGDVYSTAYDGAEFGGVVAGFAIGGLFDGGIAVAAEA